MKLRDLIARSPVPEPWSEGEKIPWHEPNFSRRMLAEHLSQRHDRASRRSEVIDAQVAWIHEQLLDQKPGRVLDLGCGPGLYVHRLTRLGHACMGVDISPASIRHARQEAERSGLDIMFVEDDLRNLDAKALQPEPFSLVMLLFGEANAFRREDLEDLLRRAHAALAPGGLLLLEPHDFETSRSLGQRPPTWYTEPAGLFSDAPYLCLHEAFWHAEHATTTERWWIVDLATGETTRHAGSMQAYTDDEYRALLARTGFETITLPPHAPETSGLVWLVGRRT